MEERALLHHTRFDTLGDYLSSAEEAATVKWESEDLTDLDYHTAQTLTNLVRARDLIESMIKEVSINYGNTDELT